MLNGVFYLLFLILIVGLMGLALWITRQSTGIDPAKLLSKRQKKRLTLVETRYLDSKRRLMLVRRDDVEHLVITGGPVDVVLESGIPAPSNADYDLSVMAAGEDSEQTDESDIGLSVQQNGAGTGTSIPTPIPESFRQD